MLRVQSEKPLTDTLLTVVRSLDQLTKQLGIPYFIIGATARDILMEHVYGLETTRATRDVDFAVAGSSWREFERLKTQLVATGEFTASATAHRLTFGEGFSAYPLDLVPFDGVELHGEIIWPPKGDFVMNVSGYADAYSSALDVEIAPGFAVKIVSLPALAVLKILAWNDRPDRDKHASDVLLILRNYYQAGQFDRLYADAVDLLELYDYDIDLAGAALLGRDVKRDVANNARNQVINVFATRKSVDRFTAQMMTSNPGDVERAAQLFEAFLRQVRA